MPAYAIGEKAADLVKGVCLKLNEATKETRDVKISGSSAPSQNDNSNGTLVLN
jgi:hypothetical protein